MKRIFGLIVLLLLSGAAFAASTVAAAEGPPADQGVTGDCGFVWGDLHAPEDGEFKPEEDPEYGLRTSSPDAPESGWSTTYPTGSFHGHPLLWLLDALRPEGFSQPDEPFGH